MNDISSIKVENVEIRSDYEVTDNLMIETSLIVQLLVNDM